jgi:Bacterial regulatory proteins, gntR family
MNRLTTLGGILAHSTGRRDKHRVLSPTTFAVSRARTLSATLTTLSEKVYAEFKRDIIQGTFQPGERLSEKDLANRYKSSRTPVREAALRRQKDCSEWRLFCGADHVAGPEMISTSSAPPWNQLPRSSPPSRAQARRL